MQTLLLNRSMVQSLLRPAIGGAGLGPEAIDAELGEILAGSSSGRSSPDQVTIFGAVGLPFQDLCAAWQVYRAAAAAQAGTAFSFLDAL